MPDPFAPHRPRVVVAPCPCGSGNWTRADGVPRCVCGRPLLVTPRPDAPREREAVPRG